ncbi:MAG: YgaP family membrane protein [Quisquiliibacterium sp.]
MTSWSFVRVFAGLMILLSLGLGLPDSPIFVSKYWLWFTAFIGLNLFQSGITKFCPLEIIMRRLGMNAGS